MAIKTAGDLIKSALKISGVIGVGQTALAEDSNDALDVLNAMIDEWNSQRFLIPHLIDVAFPATGALSYQIGNAPSGGFGAGFNQGFSSQAGVDVASRPDRIERAFARLYPGTANPIDYPLTDLQSRETYDRIALKNLSSFPQYFFWDSAYPIGNLFVWPVPSNLFEIHLSIMDRLLVFNSLADPILTPPQYRSALLYNLACRLRPQYGMGPDPTMTALAKSSLATIRAANTQIPRARMPSNLMRPGLYNIWSDTQY